MPPRDPPHPSDIPDPASELHDLLRRLGNALTVVYGQTQMLRRGIQLGRVTEAEDCLLTVQAIEGSAARMRDELHILITEASQQRTGDGT